MSSPQNKQNKRREMDVMKLLMSDWTVELPSESTKEFEVEFPGPKDSPYEGGHWVVRVVLPDEYPYKSPSIGFKNRIYHPNVDEQAGSVCLDVINQAWSPLFDLVNVFEVFLPQLLLYPNPADPLNGNAAALMLREPEAYKQKIREYVQKYARGGAAAKCSAPVPKQKRHVTKHEQPSPPRTASVHAGSPAPDSLMQSIGPLDTDASPSMPPDPNVEEEDELLGLLSDSEEEA